jgi:hypothetical protein
MATNISVEVERTDRLDEFSVYVCTEDGEALTSQEILDAIAEALLLEYGFISKERKSTGH